MIYVQCKTPACKYYPNQLVAHLVECASLAQSPAYQVQDTVQKLFFGITAVKGLVKKAFYA